MSNNKRFYSIILVIVLFSMLLTACGKPEPIKVQVGDLIICQRVYGEKVSEWNSPDFSNPLLANNICVSVKKAYDNGTEIVVVNGTDVVNFPIQ